MGAQQDTQKELDNFEKQIETHVDAYQLRNQNLIKVKTLDLQVNKDQEFLTNNPDLQKTMRLDLGLMVKVIDIKINITSKKRIINHKIISNTFQRLILTSKMMVI